MQSRVVFGGVLAALSLIGVTACGGGTPSTTEQSSKLDVVAGFYPLQFAAERIGGERMVVVNLVQPGAEPHDLELKPSQIEQIAKADLVVYLKSLQPELDKAVEGNNKDKLLDVTTISPLEQGAGAEEEGGLDPHVWLDPVRFAAIVDAIGARAAQLDSAHAAEYTSRTAALHSELAKLDSEFATGLKTCQRHEIVTSHAAFGYLAKRYGLKQIALTGLSPEEEPKPEHLSEVTKQAKELGATTIFFETLVSPKIAETVAREVGTKTAVLDPIEGLESGSTEDYLSVMRSNLKALRDALGCT
jgi:zinc transport system substrate-binding protein